MFHIIFILITILCWLFFIYFNVTHREFLGKYNPTLTPKKDEDGETYYVIRIYNVFLTLLAFPMSLLLFLICIDYMLEESDYVLYSFKKK